MRTMTRSSNPFDDWRQAGSLSYLGDRQDAYPTLPEGGAVRVRRFPSWVKNACHLSVAAVAALRLF
jgi:hypothetical protein